VSTDVVTGAPLMGGDKPRRKTSPDRAVILDSKRITSNCQRTYDDDLAGNADRFFVTHCLAMNNGEFGLDAWRLAHAK
jgi:hypothetical protein